MVHAFTGEVLRIDPVVGLEVILHVGQEGLDIDHVGPGDAAILDDRLDVIEAIAALDLDVVVENLSVGTEGHPGNILGTTHSGTDPGEKDQVT